MFLLVTQQTAVFLGKDYTHSTKKSATTNSETMVRCDTEVDQGSERNSKHIDDRLATEFLENGDLVN